MFKPTVRFWALLFSVFVVLSSGANAQIVVSSTSPSAAPQGSTNLNITVTGSGFKKGAVAQWFVSGTTNPGGVTVNSTTVNGATKITANITVSSTAVTTSFDVVVKNNDGRTGVGSDAFTVTQKGTPIGCWTTGTPSGATLQAVLNPVQSNGAALLTTLRLGNAIRVRPLDLNHDGVVDTLATFVASGSGSGSVPGTYVFLLDPTTGVPQKTNPVTGVAWQNPQLLLSGKRAGQAAAGDVNADGVPDFVMGGLDGVAYLFVGSVSATTLNPSWKAYNVAPPTGAGTWSVSVAMGDVDGIGADEVVIGSTAGGKPAVPGGAYIFKFASGSLTYVRRIGDPTGSSTGFGTAVTVGNIDGKPGNELVVGAPGANTNGLVYIFSAPAQQTTYFTLSGPGPSFGRNLGIADVNRDGTPDLVVITGTQDGSSAQGLVYAGNVYAGNTYSNQLLPASGLGNGWGYPNIDVADLAATGAVAVGAANASNGSSCSSIQGGVGALHLFTSPLLASQTANFIFEPPSLVGSSQFEFGYGVAVVPGYPFVIVGAHFQDVGTTSMAGQVYVYKLN